MSTPFARGPLLILLGALCFSTTGTVQALSPEGATPYVIGALRMPSAAWPCSLVRVPGELPRFWRWPMRCVVPSTLALLGFNSSFRGVLEAGVAVGTVVPLASRPSSWPAQVDLPARKARQGMVSRHRARPDRADPAQRRRRGRGQLRELAFPCSRGSPTPAISCSATAGPERTPGSVMMVLCLLSGLYAARLLDLPAAWLATPVGALVALHLGVVTTAIAFPSPSPGSR
ncbi:MAG: hypothetical protein ACLSHC_02285 [Bilophila wadsworthia]